MDPWQACLRLDPATDEHLENGCSYERASFDFSRFRALVLPHDAVVRRGLATDAFNVYVEKIQAFKGWPEKKLAISAFRTNMGVAFRVSGQAVALATFGEWGTSDGGGTVRLTVIIPADLELKRREDISGQASIANAQAPGQLGPGSGQPRPGWTIVKTEPNVEAIRI
jgi:hypothetical protein